MKDDHSPKKEAIIPVDSNKGLSHPSEIVNRGLELAARIEHQRGIQKYQKPIRYFAGIHAPSCIDFSKNGEFAAITSYAGSGGEDPDLIIWNVFNGDITNLSLKEQGCNFGGWFYSVALSSSGDLALAGYDDGGVLCWEVKNKMLRDFRGETYNTYKNAAVCMVFSPDDQGFVHNNGTRALMCDSRSGKFIQHFGDAPSDASYYNQMVFSNDGSKLLIGSGQFNNFMKLIDIRGDQETLLFKGAVNSRAVSIFPDNQKLLSVDPNGVITTWDAASGDMISQWSHSKDAPDPNRDRMLLHCSFRSVAVSPDGRRILSCGGDKTMHLWTCAGHEICEYPHDTQVVKAAFLPDCQYAISGCWDGSVYLWELP